MSESSFNINFGRFTRLALPIALRGSRFIAYVRLCLFSLERLHNEFLLYRALANYKLEHDSTKASLEKLLNDRFDDVQRRIYITQGVLEEPLYLYRPNEQKEVYIYHIKDYREVFIKSQNLIGSTVDFIVVCPIFLQSKEIEIKALINYYKLYSKNYVINYV